MGYIVKNKPVRHRLVFCRLFFSGRNSAAVELSHSAVDAVFDYLLHGLSCSDDGFADHLGIGVAEHTEHQFVIIVLMIVVLG